MPGKKNVEVKPTPKALPPFNLATLGTRMVTYWEVCEIKVGDTDMGKDLVVWRNVEKRREQVCPNIMLDDAMALEANLGKQDWKPWLDTTKFFVKVKGRDCHRRLFITKDIYDKLGHDER